MAFFNTTKECVVVRFLFSKKGLPKDIECDTGTTCYPEVRRLLVGSAFFGQIDGIVMLELWLADKQHIREVDTAFLDCFLVSFRLSQNRNSCYSLLKLSNFIA